MIGYEWDEPAMRGVADTLAEVSEALRRNRPEPSPRPTAGCSTGEIAMAIGHLTGAMRDLERLYATMATRLGESTDAYREADAAARARFERIPRGGA